MLDVLATAGGSKQAIAKSVVQITRGDRSLTLPLSEVVSDGRQNIILQPNDVVTVFYQPYTFTVLERPARMLKCHWKARRLACLKRSGAWAGYRIIERTFRGFSSFVSRIRMQSTHRYVRGRVRPAMERIPVIYRVDLRDPATFLVAQNFPIKIKDVL